MDILVRDLVLPQQFYCLRLQDLLPGRRTGTLIQYRCKDLDILLRLRKQSRSTGLEEAILLLCTVLLKRISIEVVADTQLACAWVTLVDLRKVGVCGRGREHGSAFRIDA